MMHGRWVRQTAVALVLVLAMAGVSVVSYAGGTAPEIVFAGFSNEIDADGIPNYGYISFKDLDKDLNEVRFVLVAGQASDLAISPGWQFDPGMQGERSGTLQFTIAAQASGHYELQVILVDAMGNESAPEEISFIAGSVVGNLPPVAAFSISPVTAKVGESIAFDASASSDTDGTIVGYAWEYGDGSSASGQQVTHTYYSVGSCTVSLTVIDDVGDSDVSIQAVSILPETGCTPTACFSLNNSAVASRRTGRESVEEVIRVGADEPIILDGTCSTCTDSHFVGVQRSDQWWNRYGPEASGWLTPAEEADIGALDVRAFAARHGVVMQPSTYYRVGLGVAEPWDSVTRLVFVEPDDGLLGGWSCQDPGIWDLPVVPWGQARYRVGDRIVVNGPVAATAYDQERKITYLNLGNAYPNQNRVTISIPWNCESAFVAEFGERPVDYFKDKTIEVYGEIERDADGAPMIREICDPDCVQVQSIGVTSQGITVLSVPDCEPRAYFTLNGQTTGIITIDASEDLILDGTASTCVNDYYLTVQLSDEHWGEHGPPAQGYLSSQEAANIGHLDVKAYAARCGLEMESGNYYRILLGVTQPWHDTIKLVFIKPG